MPQADIEFAIAETAEILHPREGHAREPNVHALRHRIKHVNGKAGERTGLIRKRVRIVVIGGADDQRSRRRTRGFGGLPANAEPSAAQKSARQATEQDLAQGRGKAGFLGRVGHRKESDLAD